MTTSNVVIIDYGMGNVGSVQNAVASLGYPVKISCDASDIESASHIILPGVGAFGDGMNNLHNFGLVDILYQAVVVKKIPFLGICLGMQLLADKGYEFGEHAGLGWVHGEVKKLIAPNLPLPHVGWDDIVVEHPEQNILFAQLPDTNFYFLHSFHFNGVESSLITSTCEYGQKFVASFRQENIFAVQFHPEKSQVSGLHVLKNFFQYA